MKRKIAVVTSSRADYSHLYWPLKDLAAHPDVDLKIVALGAHLSPEFGTTIGEIEKDGFEVAGLESADGQRSYFPFSCSSASERRT